MFNIREPASKYIFFSLEGEGRALLHMSQIFGTAKGMQDIFSFGPLPPTQCILDHCVYVFLVV